MIAGVILETARLRLRHITEDDAASLRALNDNPNVYRYTGDGPLADDDAALEIIRTRIVPQARDHGVGRWAVELRGDARDPMSSSFIGWCGLRYEADHDRYDLGYRFFEHAWGHGYATEAARATLTWGRARFPRATIVGRVLPANVASVRVLEKLGMTRVGVERDHDGDVDVYLAPSA